MSNNTDRALGTKPYSNSRTPTTKLVQENTLKVLKKRRPGIKVVTILIWTGVLIAGVILYKTSPEKVWQACSNAGVMTNICKS